MTEDEINREIARQDYESMNNEARDRIQYQVDYSKTLLHSLMLGNGGAIIAILTFVGNTGSKVDPARMMWAFGLYAAGLACVFIAHTGAFFSQYFYYKASQYEAWNAQAGAFGAGSSYDTAAEVRRGSMGLALGVTFALVSLICFIAGSVSALRALI
ncbi:hypothetical protein AB1K62_14420 [Parasphingorhabdus sp. JC815]|uniref:hypothetical protein n=1 Tax=Parasphingorhabdus sp. JC815 TaxID=3232140 RepID=UPI00345A318F